MELGLRFRDRIEAIAPELSQEFDELMENLLGAWLNEHTDEDQHGDIHATSLTIRKGSAAEIASGIKTGTIDTDGLGPHKLGGPLEIRGLDVFGAAQVNPILISLLVGISGTGTVGAGILLPSVAGGGNTAWALINSDDNWNTSIGFYDATSNIEVLKLYRESAGTYSLNPSEDGVATVKLGDRTQSALIFDECAAFHFYERNDAGLGWWTAVAHAGANFTASAGTWTVDAADQQLYRYTLVGKKMTVAWNIINTDVSAAAVLRLKIPGGFTAAQTINGFHESSDAGAAAVVATCRTVSGQTYIELYPGVGTGGTYTITAADNTYTIGQLTFEVQ